MVLRTFAVSDKPDWVRAVFSSIAIFGIVVGLYFTNNISYLLFHTLCEGVCVIVAVSIAIVAWYSSKYIASRYLVFIGIGYLFVAFLDLFHALTYHGMQIFPGPNDYATQLWIAARYMESCTLLVGVILLRTRSIPSPYVLIVLYTALTGFIVFSVFSWRIFPECFVEGMGLTPFKKISEYIICTILAVTALLLVVYRDRFERNILILLLASLVVSIVSELMFTLYISKYGPANLAGHFLKLFSYLLIFWAIVKTGLENPLKLIFRDLEQSNHLLSKEIERRKRIQLEREKLIDSMQRAMEEIKTLKGIIPICMHCKKIRDDQGYWNQIEKYISEHSTAEISHGLCPECLREYYPAAATRLGMDSNDSDKDC